MNIRHDFKSIPMQLDSIHSECHHTTFNTLEWKGERILVKYIKYTFDGPDIYFFRSLEYSLRIFVTATKSYGVGNGNPLFLIGPLQPWQTLTFLSRRLTKVMRTSLQVASRITFTKSLRKTYLYKEAFPVLWIFL